jgi:dTDP-4-dehydrorhamnose reductase
MILLLGNGLLGSEVARCLKLNNIKFFQPDRKDFDVTSGIAGIEYFFEQAHQPIWGNFSCLINTIGFAKVDAAEIQKDEAMYLNAYSVNKLASLCRKANMRLIHISTDFIFDGTHSVEHPYIEEDLPNPVNYYGYTKLLGEQMIKESGCKYLIVRSGKLYNQNKGFIFSILNKMRNESYIQGVKNQVFSPTNAFALANQLIPLYKNGITGVYHATNTGYTSAFDLINFMKGVLKSAVRVDESCLYEHFTPARRPAMTVLSMKKLESLGLLVMPSWQESLDYTLRSL